jgi:desulfoferrodoxin-like iron-binding protein
MSEDTGNCWPTSNKAKCSKKTRLPSGSAETAVTYTKATKLLRAVQSVTTQEATLKFGAKTTKQTEGGVNVTEKGQIYVCEICGNKVEVIEASFGTLVCCGQPMTLVE